MSGKIVGVKVKGTDTAAQLFAETPGDAEYKACPASATTTLGATGGVGDLLKRLVITPGTTAAASVQIKDGSNAAITVFTGGGTLSDLKPFTVELGLRSVQGAWQVINGANVTAVAVGNFT